MYMAKYLHRIIDTDLRVIICFWVKLLKKKNVCFNMLHLSHYKIIYHHILNIFHFLVHAYSMLHILECLLLVIQTRIFMFMNLHVPCNTCVLSFWGKPDRFPLWYLLEQGKSGDDLKLHILLSHPSICKKKFQLYNTQFMKRQNHMSILVYIHVLWFH